MPHVISSVEKLDFSITDLPDMPLPTQVLMVDPTYFTVDYIINPHMENSIGTVDKTTADTEWKQLKSTFDKIGLTTHTVNGQKNLPDMVFCANQSLPYIDPEGERHVIMSIMHSDYRKKEVTYIEQWYRDHGYHVHHLDSNKIDGFEGCGDAVWHRHRRLLWGGYGFRSSVGAYREISDLFDVPVVTLELVDDDFYHLDTCFCVLNETTVLTYPKAFTDDGLQLIDRLFNHVIHANEDEAKNQFACNAVCPDGKNVLIQRGCVETTDQLEQRGFTVHPIDTNEFLKSGGSVFCMKQMVW